MTKTTAFEKRVKRRVTARRHDFFAVCPPGLTGLCFRQLQRLGFKTDQLARTTGGIEFTGKPEEAIRASLHLKYPVRLLMRLSRFRATDFDSLIKKADQVDWPLFLAPDRPVSAHVTLHKSRLYHSDAVAQRLEQVIQRQMAIHSGSPRAADPPPDTENPETQTLHVRAERDRFTLSLDICGAPLYKRGIKPQSGRAPIRENLAAALLAWAGFGPDDILIDPMCGSGTFSLEAAMVCAGLPAGFFRAFAFEGQPGFSAKTLAHMKKKTMEGIRPGTQKRIFAFDRDETAVDALEKNLGFHPFLDRIQAQTADFFSLEPARLAKEEKGVITLNPPYGKRLDIQGGKPAFYRELKKKLTQDFRGWRLALILPAMSDYRLLGLKLETRRVFHGGLDAVAAIGRPDCN